MQHHTPSHVDLPLRDGDRQRLDASSTATAASLLDSSPKDPKVGTLPTVRALVHRTARPRFMSEPCASGRATNRFRSSHHTSMTLLKQCHIKPQVSALSIGLGRFALAAARTTPATSCINPGLAYKPLQVRTNLAKGPGAAGLFTPQQVFFPMACATLGLGHQSKSNHLSPQCGSASSMTRFSPPSFARIFGCQDACGLLLSVGSQCRTLYVVCMLITLFRTSIIITITIIKGMESVPCPAPALPSAAPSSCLDCTHIAKSVPRPLPSGAVILGAKQERPERSHTLPPVGQMPPAQKYVSAEICRSPPPPRKRIGSSPFTKYT